MEVKVTFVGQERPMEVITVTSIGPLQADGSYVSFCQLALADKNSLIYVGFFLGRRKL
jgi:hypothetical protein